MAHYAFLNNDHTTETLREELLVLWNEMGNLTSEEEKDTGAIETKQEEIDAKQQEIDNSLCIVTRVITGVLETYEEAGKDETLHQELKDLENSRAGKNIQEIVEIEAEMQIKLEEIQNLPPDIIDNTVYWEGYYGKGGLCKRTSFNTHKGVHLNDKIPFRKNYAGEGYTYDPVRDAFYGPQPFESWTLNEDTCSWESPVAIPEDGNSYLWDEETKNWILEE